MVDQTSQMFITGPAVVQAVTNENVDKEGLGGAMVHNATSGVAHFIAESDQDAVQIARKLLSYMPGNNLNKPKVIPSSNKSYKLDKKIYSVVPTDSKKAFDVRDIIDLTFDKNSFFEVQEYFAQNIVIGFARIGGRSVGIIANQPSILAGVLDIDASDKAARFIRFCDSFNIPVITFVDTPGFLPVLDRNMGE